MNGTNKYLFSRKEKFEIVTTKRSSKQKMEEDFEYRYQKHISKNELQ